MDRRHKASEAGEQEPCASGAHLRDGTDTNGTEHPSGQGHLRTQEMPPGPANMPARMPARAHRVP